MRDSRGGLASGLNEVVTLGGGFAHSSLIVDGSRVPRILDEGREDLMREGAWISE
jgi:hypothetical protein